MPRKDTKNTGNLADFSLYGGAESLAEGQPPMRSSRRTVIERPQPGYGVLQPPQDPSDFLWLMTEEPHRSRRMEILKVHPEVSGNARAPSSTTLTRRGFPNLR
jgi:sphingolipid 4-desaturase/C4-monooxygenase